MSQKLKIGYFEHWFRPPYAFVDFLAEQGIALEKIDYSQRGYLEKYDVAIIEQHGFNDYIENDESYIQDWVSRGGIVLFMHQDYQRFAPYFLPHKEVGYIQLIHRYVETIYGFGCCADKTFTNDPSPYKAYMMPWIEECGRRLFSEPEEITPDDMIMWNIDVNTFGMNHTSKKNQEPDHVRTAALSCYLPNDNWEVIGSFMDPTVRDGALIMRARHGAGMYFMNQLLFPEVLTPEADRCLAFWKKYVKNLMAYFERFKNGESEEIAPKSNVLPIKKNYKMTTHMHSLDWYGCDSAPGTINALMRYMDYDICTLAIKDNAPYAGKLDTAKYSDDKVLFLDGQEYHPFNWNDKYSDMSHNAYHALAIGIDPAGYTTEFTCSRFSDEEVDDYLKNAIDYVHKHNGVICATHPRFDYWHAYDFDAVDREPMAPLSGTPIEAYWLAGGRKTLINSVDLFGVRRILDDPAVNFIYLKGKTPTRDTVVEAIRAGYTIAAAGFDEADITLNGYLPGEELTAEEAADGVLSIAATVMRHNITKVHVYSGADVIYAKEDIDTPSIDLKVPLKGLPLDKFIRVEIQGLNEHWICNSTPFYLK